MYNLKQKGRTFLKWPVLSPMRSNQNSSFSYSRGAFDDRKPSFYLRQLVNENESSLFASLCTIFNLLDFPNLFSGDHYL